MATPLGKITRSGNGAPPSAPEDPTSKLGKFHALGQRGEFTEIPRLGRVWIELVHQPDAKAIEAEVWSEMMRLGIPPNVMNALTYDTAKSVRMLAVAVRDADDPTHAAPFGTLAEWDALDVDMIAAATQIYNDVRYRLNPIDEDITPAEFAEIKAVLEKKNAMGLRLFGVAKLAHYMLSSESQRNESPTPESSSGPSPQE